MGEEGSILLITLALLILLVSLVGGFLYAAGVFIGNSGWEETDAKVLWLAEAGMQKAVWNLKTPAGEGGQGENWTTPGTAEDLGDGSYTMVVERWDFDLSANGATASSSPAQTDSSIGPANAIDGNDATYWQSLNKPTNSNPQDLIIHFPYTLVVNKVRFLAAASANRPRDYEWAVSSDGFSYTTVVSNSGNSSTDVTDTFAAQSGVNYLRLRTTKPGQGSSPVQIATLEAIGSRITSTGTLSASGSNTTRSARQSFVIDDGSFQGQMAYKEPDWSEL